MKSFGIFLLALGMMAWAYEGFSYASWSAMIDFGPMAPTFEPEKIIPISQVVVAAILIAGSALLYAGANRCAVAKRYPRS